jgi:hypothetical protein
MCGRGTMLVSVAWYVGADCDWARPVRNARPRIQAMPKDLRRQEDPAPVGAVRLRAPQEHERQQGRFRREGPIAQEAWIAEALVDDPRKGDVLGPGADAAQEGADPQRSERGRPEGRREGWEPRGRAGGWRFVAHSGLWRILDST